MKAIVSVIGKDKVGIIASVSGALSEMGVNILDISQTILNDWFTMLMVVEIIDGKLADVQTTMTDVGKKSGVNILVQHQEIFDAMHKL